MNQTSQATNTVSDAQRGLRYRVLIVEDDADIRELIRYNHAQEEFIVEEAADGAQALEKVKRCCRGCLDCRSAARCVPSARQRICRS